MVPLVVAQEQADMKAEIKGRQLSFVFDGTTRLGEALAIVIRFIDSSFLIQQHLIRLQLLSKSMTGEEIAREIMNTLSAQYSASSNLLVAAIHDCALVAAIHDCAACNTVALRTIKAVFPSLVDVGCFSHTLNLNFQLHICYLSWSGGSVYSVIVRSQCCFGKRELGNRIEGTLQLDGGVSLKY